MINKKFKFFFILKASIYIPPMISFKRISKFITIYIICSLKIPNFFKISCFVNR